MSIGAMLAVIDSTHRVTSSPGGLRRIVATRIVLTSATHPRSWYGGGEPPDGDGDDNRQLSRRRSVRDCARGLSDHGGWMCVEEPVRDAHPVSGSRKREGASVRLDLAPTSLTRQG